MPTFIRSPRGRLTVYGVLLGAPVLGFVLYRQAGAHRLHDVTGTAKARFSFQSS